jgi:hypothetical protein
LVRIASTLFDMNAPEFLQRLPKSVGLRKPG